jgi:hypothetical protein
MFGTVRLHVQADPRRADHLQISGLGIARERENVRSSLEATVVGGAGSQTDGRTRDGRGRIRRIIAKPARGAGGGWVSAKPAGWLEIPCASTGGRWPAGQISPAAGTSNEQPHP